MPSPAPPRASSLPAPAAPRSFLAALGPGLLFAGAAVGVSHLVQSTRAGATYGIAMLSVVLLANVVKFPAFRFGPHYAAATGTSLLEGYRRQGPWVLVVFALLTLGTMFTVAAVVTLVNAGIAISFFDLGPWLESTVGAAHGPAAVSAAILILSSVLLATGGYVWLDRLMKVVLPLLSVLTLAATILAIGRIDWSQADLLPPADAFVGPGVLFTVALIGWMPSAIDISVWSSLWTLARARQVRSSPDVRNVLRDFDLGYLVTLILAFAFVLLGTELMFGRGVTFADNAAGFASQVIDLYTDNLGAWSRPIIGIAALLVMFSTVVTVVDGFPRVIAGLVEQFWGPASPTAPPTGDGGGRRAVYAVACAVLTLGAVAILVFAMSSFKALVDLATTLSFLTAPVLSWFNHRAVQGEEVPVALRASRAMLAWSWIAILLQAAFAAWFLWIKFGAGR